MRVTRLPDGSYHVEPLTNVQEARFLEMLAPLSGTIREAGDRRAIPSLRRWLARRAARSC